MAESGPMWEIVTRLNVMSFQEASAEITAIIGVEPTATWREGDLRIPAATIRHKENGWQLRSPVDPHNTTPEQSVASLLALLPNLSVFKRLPQATEVQLTCTIYGLTERPYFYLPHDLILQLAEIGASLDIDPYDLSSDADEGEAK